MSSAKLGALHEFLVAHGTQAFLVVRRDRIVHEWYAAESSVDKKQGMASLAKALVGGLSLAISLSDGRVRLDDPVSKFVPQWRDDPRKSKITFRHLGSHTSGLDDAEADWQPHDKLTGWKSDFWKQLEPPRDPFTLARDVDPVLFEPGEKLQYSNPGIGMLMYGIAAALRDAPTNDLRALLRDRIMRPIGVDDGDWSVGYGKTFHVDGLPLIPAWGGGAITPRALARVGRLVLREGDWDGERILSAEAVRQATQDAGLPDHCGIGWWTNGGKRYAGLPRDAVWGAGAGDQTIFIVPSRQLIMVRNGKLLQPPADSTNNLERFHDGRARILFTPMVEAVVSESPD